MTTHVEESAELYALGLLSEAERAEVDAHAATCPQCTRRIGEAEETVLALERGVRANIVPRSFGKRLPFERRAAGVWWIAAVAAAFVLGVLVTRVLPPADDATLAMIHSHFSHAQFAGPRGETAKVLYARDRSWYYVIVDGGRRYDVYGLADGRSTLLGTIRPKGAAGELFVRTRTRFDRIELRENGNPIESATIR